MRSKLGVTDAQIRLSGMLFLSNCALSSPFAGVVADRFSRSRSIVEGLIFWKPITLRTGFATGLMMRLAYWFYMAKNRTRAEKYSVGTTLPSP